MKQSTDFGDIVERVCNLPLESREDLKSLLDHNITEARRDEMLANFKLANEEHKAGKLQFSDDVDVLMKML